MKILWEGEGLGRQQKKNSCDIILGGDFVDFGGLIVLEYWVIVIMVACSVNLRINTMFKVIRTKKNRKKNHKEKNQNLK